MESVLLTGYKKYKRLPGIDELLDWRRRLEHLKSNDSTYPTEWYDNEIAATDFLLAKHSP
jgi:hypothetical protein